MAPITICHPVWQLGRGGLEQQLLQVIDRLPRERFRHVLLVRGWDDACAAAARSLADNVTVVAQPSNGRERLWSIGLTGILRQEAVDVLHVRGLTMLLDSFLAARLCSNVRLAFSFHGFERAGAQFGPLRRRLLRAAIARGDDCWAVSRSAARAIAAELGLPESRFEILPNGVDTQRYVPALNRAEVRHRLGLPHNRLVVLSMGNLKPVKGHDVLLQAVRGLGAEADGAAFVLVGGDYLSGELHRWAGRHLSGGDIRFVGEQVDALPWYQAADFFVLPSRWEGLSNALLEAMSCGLPAIATAVGGNADVIEDRRTGLLVRADEPEELSAAIRRLLCDEGYRNTLGEAGRREVLTRFAMDRTVAEYAKRYEALAAGEVRRGGRVNGRREEPAALGDESLERAAP